MIKKPSRFLIAFDKAFTYLRLLGFGFIAMIVTSPGFREFVVFHERCLDAGSLDASYIYGVVDVLLVVSFVGFIKAVFAFCSYYAASSKEVSGDAE